MSGFLRKGNFERDLFGFFDDFFDFSESSKYYYLKGGEKDDFVFEKNVIGFGKEDLSISVEDGYLKIVGKKNINGKERTIDCSYIINNIVDEVDIENISATVENGLLTIVFPKRAQKKEKSINIKIK